MFGEIGLPEIFVMVLIVAFSLVVPCRIVSKAGYSKWLGLTTLIPIINIVLCWFAFADWPALRRTATRL